MAGIEFKPVAILVGDGQFADGAQVAALIKAGVVEFVEGVDGSDGGVRECELPLVKK